MDRSTVQRNYCYYTARAEFFLTQFNCVKKKRFQHVVVNLSFLFLLHLLTPPNYYRQDIQETVCIKRSWNLYVSISSWKRTSVNWFSSGVMVMFKRFHHATHPFPNQIQSPRQTVTKKKQLIRSN